VPGKDVAAVTTVCDRRTYRFADIATGPIAAIHVALEFKAQT